MESNRRLFVGNLPYQVLERDIEDQFRGAGVVVSVNLMLDKMTGRSRGFAFVEFSTPEEANKAVEMFHGKAARITDPVPGGRPRSRLPSLCSNRPVAEPGGFSFESQRAGKP